VGTANLSNREYIFEQRLRQVDHEDRVLQKRELGGIEMLVWTYFGGKEDYQSYSLLHDGIQGVCQEDRVAGPKHKQESHQSSVFKSAWSWVRQLIHLLIYKRVRLTTGGDAYCLNSIR
jgi:hypothetical protein